MKLRLFILLQLFFIEASCDNSEHGGDPLKPANLVIAVTGLGSGVVAVTATADHANFYSVYFGDTSNEVPVHSVDGKASHTYEESGDYTVTVFAHATAAVFTEGTEEISIEIEPATNGPVVIPATGYVSPTSYDGMTLAWEDNFDGESLNTNHWTPEIGRGSNGWGNNELQYYRAENTSFQDGNLIITAKKEEFGGAQYTSSRLITKDKKAFKYGRIDIRAALPKGQGLWPALWMLGSNFSSVGWPKCGEIDIMEMVGGPGRDNTVHGTLHWDNAGHHACTCNAGPGYSLNTGVFADEFHVFSIVWNGTSIKWYVDNVQFHVIDVSPAEMSEFDENFFLIFNVAVGGNWPGSPDNTTVFPQYMIVDYVRVFQ